MSDDRIKAEIWDHVSKMDELTFPQKVTMFEYDLALYHALKTQPLFRSRAIESD